MGQYDALAQISDFLREYVAYKEENGVIDFLDMLERYLDTPTALDVDVVILDEAQDLSKLQWEIFRHMIQDAQRVYIAGDDDQAIYNFIGADPHAFNAFPADEVRVLHQSWRVPWAIGDYAERIIETVEDRMPKEITWLDVPGTLMGDHINYLEDYINEERDTLILCRHRRQVLQMSERLKHIPHSIDDFSLVNSRWSKHYATWARLTGVGIGDQEIDVADIRKLHRYLGDKDWQPGMPYNELVLLPIWQVVTTDRDKMVTLWNHVRKYGLEVLNKPPKLRIMTMHAAKGKEADDVFILTDCNDTVYNNRHSPEETRLRYVAMTRAKRNCVIVSPQTGTYLEGFF